MTGPGAIGQGLAVDAGDGLDLAGRRREERLVRPVQRVERERGLLDRDPQPGRELEHQRARDAEQAAGLTGRRVEHAREHEEDVRSGRLAQLAPRVREHRFAGTVLPGVGERPHVLRVRDRLEPGDRTALVAGPRDGDHVRHVGPGRELARRDDHRRCRLAPFGARAAPRRR